MMQNLIECLRVLKDYTGMRILLALTLAAWVYLLVREKNKAIKAVFVILPIAVMLIFVFPLTRTLFDIVGMEGEIYYRLLWLIPMGIIAVYGVVKISSKNVLTRVIGLVLATAFIVFGGQCVYTSPSFFPSTNIYGLPQQTVDIVDFIRANDDHKLIRVLPSADLVTTIRQYDSQITIPYGRDYFVNTYEDELFDAFERSDILDYSRVVEAARPQWIEYIITHVAKPSEGNPEDYGLELLGIVDDHYIYRDNVMREMLYGDENE